MTKSSWVVLVGIFSLLSVSSGRAGTIHVAVAANFARPFEAIADQFESVTGNVAIPSYASTGTLYAQIVNHAPYDLFFAADSRRPMMLAKQGLAVEQSRRTYALGRLVFWSSDAGFVDNDGTFLKKVINGRLAIANPEIAPYGRAAQQTLESLGQWDRVRKQLARGQSVGQAFQFAATGNVRGGFVAWSQVKTSRWASVGSSWLVPAKLHAPIEQQMVVLDQGKDNPTALEFYEFVKKDTVQNTICEFGYGGI
jgi:molybdate transport system substrate-binding protein